MSDRTPACQKHVLRGLYVIKDAVLRDEYIEAMKHIGDYTSVIQNEREWCFDTDPILPAMNAFMLQLGDSIGTLERVHRSQRQSIKLEIIGIIDSTVNEIAQVSSGQSNWDEPDAKLDLLEKEHRVNKYKG